LQSSHNGKVYLVGAGPGDVELLTLKAIRCLQSCDAVLIDDLANPEILQFAKNDVEVIHVGKRGGCDRTPQELIDKTMIDLARQGKLVVRLKGGDPFIFGRGGEELNALRDAGIDVEIINGVTAGVAAASVLGIPLTHRDMSHGVSFVTGHCLKDNQPNWKSLANTGTTIVIYMGISNLPEITTSLIAAGYAPSTAVAVIQSATLPDQRIVITTLSQLAPDVEAAAITSPAIIIIGEVVKLSYLQQPSETNPPAITGRGDAMRRPHTQPVGLALDPAQVQPLVGATLDAAQSQHLVGTTPETAQTHSVGAASAARPPAAESIAEHSVGATLDAAQASQRRTAL
jgi:uroporphyrin-III C-methyltransferase